MRGNSLSAYRDSRSSGRSAVRVDPKCSPRAAGKARTVLVDSSARGGAGSRSNIRSTRIPRVDTPESAIDGRRPRAESARQAENRWLRNALPPRGEHSSLRLPIRPTPATAAADGLRDTEHTDAGSGEPVVSSDYRHAAERYIRVKSRTGPRRGSGMRGPSAHREMRRGASTETSNCRNTRRGRSMHKFAATFPGRGRAQRSGPAERDRSGARVTFGSVT